MNRRYARRLGRVAAHIVLLAASVAMLAPMAWMFSTSLRVGLQTPGRAIEWLPWRDVWRQPDGHDVFVLPLGALVQRRDHDERLEVAITSLASRNRYTSVRLPGEQFEGEILEYRVRPNRPGSTGETIWIPFDALVRRIHPEWSNYSEAMRKMSFVALLQNTAAITVLGTVGTLLSCSLVAYGFARFRFPGRSMLFMVLLSGMMLPGVVTMIPVYLVFRQLGWIDTLLPLFVPAWFGVNAFAVFLFRQFYMNLPFDLDEAARLDGCGAFRIYWSVLLPLSKPVLATVAIFSFTGYWLDFMTPLIYLNTPTKFTLSLGLYIFKGPYTVEWNYLMAATLLVSLPCIVLFLVGQRFFISGVVMSGLKG